MMYSSIYTYLIGDAFLILNDLYGGAGLTFSPNSHTTASTARISTNRALSSSSSSSYSLSSSSSSNRRSGGGDISMTRISIASSGMVGYLYTIIICMLYTMLYYVMILCYSCYHRHHFIPIIALLYQLHHPFDRREDRISRSLQPLPIRTDDEVL